MQSCVKFEGKLTGNSCNLQLFCKYHAEAQVNGVFYFQASKCKMATARHFREGGTNPLLWNLIGCWKANALTSTLIGRDERISPKLAAHD